MPFVKISALPSQTFNVDEIMEAIENDLYDPEKKILPKGSATFLWQRLDCITHTRENTAKQESLFEFDPKKEEFPIFIDLYLTTVFTYDEVAKVMKSIASTLSDKTSIDPKYVFIHAHIGTPGHVFISNDVWPGEIGHAGIKKESEGE